MIILSNSSLVSYTKISPNKNSPRTHKIDTITIHCTAGWMTVESMGNWFHTNGRSSCNYGVATDGRIALIVDEKDRSWCSSNSANDNRAITIEVSSSSSPPYEVKDVTYRALINLLVDICQRNGIPKLLWKADKSLIGNVSQQNMTVHRWFKNKACPGDYLYSRHYDIANQVNSRLGTGGTLGGLSNLGSLLGGIAAGAANNILGNINVGGGYYSNGDPSGVGYIESVPTIEVGNIYANTVPLTPTSIVGSRVSEFTSQPMSAYVNLYIGDKLLSTEPPKPNLIREFSINKTTDNVVDGEFTIFDDNWEEIEYYFSNNMTDVYVEYGYSGTNIKSNYNIQVTDYTVDFVQEGTLMNIKFITSSTLSNLNTTNISTNTTNPTEAIKTICKDLGWVVKNENFVETRDVHLEHPFNSAQEFPLKYIKEVIIPQAQTENGEIVRFYTEETEISDGKKLVVPHVEKITYKPRGDSLRTYIYRTGYDTVVKELTFDIKGIEGGTSVFHTVTGVRTNVFNTETKSFGEIEENSDTVTTEATGEYTHTSSSQSVVLVDSAGSTEEQAKNKLYYYMKNAETRHYEATMVLVGDPHIGVIGDNIRVINMTDKGYLHHTSGLYMILGVTDSISNGEMQTILKLARNGDINDGVELLNPKRLIK